MRLVTLSEQQFDSYAKNHLYRNYYQTSEYGRLMDNYGFDCQYIGYIDDNNRILAASLILYKQIFMNYKYAYAPRGFLIDYKDEQLLSGFIEQLKKLLYKQNFIFLKIDPQIFVSERNKKGDTIAYNPETNNIITRLKHLGFTHQGQNKYFETIKPRWEAIIKLNTDSDILYKSLAKQTRNKISKAIKSGVEVFKNESDNIEDAYRYIKKKHTRNLNYYKDFYRIYNDKDMFDIYYAKLNTSKYVKNSKKFFEIEMQRNEKINNRIQENPQNKHINKLISQKMESDKLLNIYKNNLVEATRMLKDKPDGFPLGAAFIIKYENTAYLLIEGFNSKFKKFNSNYLLKWVIIQNCIEQEYKIFNLNGVTGDFSKNNKYYGLNEMKTGYSASIIEYIGEFDYVINPIIYNIYSGLKPVNNSVKKENQ